MTSTRMSTNRASITGPYRERPIRLADLPEQSLSWLWPGWIPNGSLTILAGHAGEGKSTILAALVGAITSGSPLPDGATVPPANVMLLAAEDDPSRVIRPRLIANGADPDRVFMYDRVGDIHALHHVIEDHDIRLLAIDPFTALSRRLDRGGESELRAALSPLTELVADLGIACIGVMRLGKGGYGRRPAQRIVGASVMPAIARSVIMAARIEASSATGSATGNALGSAAGEEEPNGRDTVLQVVKGNYAASPPPVALRLGIHGAVQWLGPADSGIDALAESAADHRLTVSERADAADFLREFLAEGPLSADVCLRRAKSLGFSEITLRRAKKDVGIVSSRRGEYGYWEWRLPDAEEKGDNTPAGG